MTIAYPQLASQWLQTPLMLHTDKIDVMARALLPRIFGAVAGTDMAVLGAEQIKGDRYDYKVIDGIAHLPITGTLVQRGDNMGYSGTTAYHALDRRLQQAVADPAVKAILLDMDTPGGLVSGCFDFAQRVYDMRGTKPIIAVAGDMAASAGYMIASAADEIVVAQAGAVGSIGVRVVHADYSQQLAAEGVKFTVIDAGAHKSEGNPYEPLPPDVRDRIQAEVNDVYSIFVRDVARNRGMSEQAVRDTEAAMYMGQKAVGVGLANRVGTLDSEHARLVNQFSSAAGSRRYFMSNGGQKMTQANNGGEPGVLANQQFVNSADLISRVEATQMAEQAAREATLSERQRVLGVMADAATLGVSGALVTKLISNGTDAALSKEVLFETKAAIDDARHIQTAHDSGGQAKESVKPAINTNDIYARRNAR